MSPTHRIGIVRELLDLASELADGSDRADQFWLGRLRELAAELVEDEPIAEATAFRGKGGTIVIREAGLTPRLELIFLPPDPPKLKDCPRCGGRRIEGTGEP